MIKVHVSGVQSGSSPAPGLGIARCLKNAFTDLRIVGVDYSARSLGFHSNDIDELLILPPWSQIDDALLAASISSTCAEHLWLPALDLEIRWAAEMGISDGRYLGPHADALAAVNKPGTALEKVLPARIPDYRFLEGDEWSAVEFCRQQNWDVWMKGPHYEAYPVRNFDQFRWAKKAIAEKWKTERIFIQKNIAGFQESICFCAYHGTLLGALHMKKTEISAEGKTWGGLIGECSLEWTAVVERLVRDLGWTGGAEIELIIDADGTEWFMELNPRFPAWIYGAALAGINLPARLVGHAMGRDIKQGIRENRVSTEFVRITQEIPAREGLSLVQRSLPAMHANNSAGKYQKAFSGLLERWSQKWGNAACEETNSRDKKFSSSAVVRIPQAQKPVADFEAEVQSVLDKNWSLPTPQKLLLRNHTQSLFSQLSQKLKAASTNTIAFSAAYSLKTSPEPDYLELARAHGFYAECISQFEASAAEARGFRKTEIVLNGPGKFWPEFGIGSGVHSIFCDTLEELELVLQRRIFPRHLGLRLRPTIFESRFGVSFAEFEEFKRAAHLLKAIPRDVGIGVHFHLASSGYGIPFWWDCLDSVLRWAWALQAEIERPVTLFDIGGGWFPDDFRLLDLMNIRERVRAQLSGVREIVLEPGKALTQESVVLVSRALSVQRAKGRVHGVIVDTSINDFPMHRLFPRRCYWASATDAQLRPLTEGNGKIFGRICMEDDVICETVDLPSELQSGDYFIFCDMGAYNRSMCYEFGMATGKEFMERAQSSVGLTCARGLIRRQSPAGQSPASNSPEIPTSER